MATIMPRPHRAGALLALGTGGFNVNDRQGLYLLRHGRTALNADGKLRGRIDVPLDDVGIIEAERLGVLFERSNLGCVISSPLARAVQTASAVAVRHGLEVDVDEGLADRDWGPWAGELEADVTRRFGSLDAAPGAEALESFVQRITRAVTRIIKAASGRAIVAVAHDAVNRTLLSSLVPQLGIPGAIPQRTGCWNCLLHESGAWSAPIVDAVPGDGTLPC